MENQEDEKTNIYILKLEHGKYYVGKSQNVVHRLIEHRDKKGSAWTKKYPMLDILAVYRDCDDFDEDKYVKKCMLKYGIDNVRGGAYCQILMSDEHYDFLKRELWHSQDQCIRCGQTGHFADQCTRDDDCDDRKASKSIHMKCDKCDSNEHTTRDCVNVLDDNPEDFIIPECYRCGRDTHTEADCDKCRHINGSNLRCQICKRFGHAKQSCKSLS